MEQQNEIVKKVLNYIEGNIEKEINVDKIARSVGYSKFYLNRLFSQCTGITIYKYLQSRRLTIAAEKLIKTDDPITKIAYEAGYESQQAFSLAFKQLYVYPPKTYRNIGVFVPKQSRISLSKNFYKTKYSLFISMCKGTAA
ncbi:AraC family transcriptional regulator [Lactonifactor longoviformis]|uniref:AraC-type DNA-binding protein n=1 Tax=Lactonifactor longoviformis DSM 17459 TaxID=1122155 RepID=A0A1M5A7D3_9CLOT|nr:AraC family transcriptional regulator [Lactonifactor longoviformis]POP32859.1 AraC family transcriptional regulator [Lactonifactor longoviformis]SHF26221.1 AraC-type DNA-binding protein [Lactonifactor longoviformis DSM 17459]